VADARRRGSLGRAHRYPGPSRGDPRARPRFGEIGKQKQVKPS
jgi:hypothetical protein